MRVIFINAKPIFRLDSTSHKFWFNQFRKQSTDFWFIHTANWNINQIKNWNPDHIHFSSDALPRTMWMPLSKIKSLRKVCPHAVITSYRGGVGKEKEHLNKLNPLMDAAFGSNDYYKEQIWLPAPSSPKFWRHVNLNRKKIVYRIIHIGHGSAEHLKTMKKRGITFTKHRTLKAVQAKFGQKFTLIGSGWKQLGLNHFPPTPNYDVNKNYYHQSLIGLNVVHDSLRIFPKYWSSRLMHMMMSGLACITPYQPEIETVMEHGKHILFYKNDNELIKLLTHYIDKEDELRQMGKDVCELACKQWNSKLAVQRILAVRKKCVEKKSSTVTII